MPGLGLGSTGPGIGGDPHETQYGNSERGRHPEKQHDFAPPPPMPTVPQDGQEALGRCQGVGSGIRGSTVVGVTAFGRPAFFGAPGFACGRSAAPVFATPACG